MPSRWSNSCWKMRASHPSASISNGVAVEIGRAQDRALGAPQREPLARERQAALGLLVDVGLAGRRRRDPQFGVDRDAAPACAVVVDPAVREEPKRHADLRCRETDARRGIHRLEHVARRACAVLVDRLDGEGGGVQHRITGDSYGEHGHSARISGGQRVGSLRGTADRSRRADPARSVDVHRDPARARRRRLPLARGAVPASRRREGRGAHRRHPRQGAQRTAAHAAARAAVVGHRHGDARPRDPVPALEPLLRTDHRRAAARRDRARDHVDRELARESREAESQVDHRDRHVRRRRVPLRRRRGVHRGRQARHRRSADRDPDHPRGRAGRRRPRLRVLPHDASAPSST